MKLEKETSVFKRDAIKNGIALAKKKATDFLTELANGVFVHAEGTPSDPTDSQAEGVRITDSIDIIHEGESVASYGTEARVGRESSGNVLVRSNGIALRDGLKELATLQQSGMDINTYDVNGNAVNIAHLGYGEGAARSGTDVAPYYTFGTRPSASAVGNNSMAEGLEVTASGYASHAEGHATAARGLFSHAEGELSEATEWCAHAEGGENEATAWCAHAEGFSTTASGTYSHTEGYNSTAGGDYSHAQNQSTKASKDAQTSIGTYNIEDIMTTTTHPSGKNDYGQYALIVGNGTTEVARSNALTIDWSGNVNAAGKYRLGASGEYALMRYYSVTTSATTIPGNSGALCQTTFTMPSPYTHVIGVRQISTNHGVATGINTFGVDGDGASGNTITCHAYVRNFNSSTITDEMVTFEMFLAAL